MKSWLRQCCAVPVYLATASAALAHGGPAQAEVREVLVRVDGGLRPAFDASATLTHGGLGIAPTEAEARAAFDAARRNFLAVAEGGGDFGVAGHSGEPLGPGVVAYGAGGVAAAGNRPGGASELESIRLVMDVEDMSLRNVLAKIVGQAATYTGPWTVKWRLRPENMDILDERVNLTAEAPFGEFCALLTERVKNMTGTQLFVTAFNNSRVILVTDTYY